MTGSGKTGLCLDILEEAAMDGIPAIAIDPKGDLGNLLLTFPDLKAENFRPWIDEDEARRQNLDPEVFAAHQADTWRKAAGTVEQEKQKLAQLETDLAAEVAALEAEYNPAGEALEKTTLKPKRG